MTRWILRPARVRDPAAVRTPRAVTQLSIPARPGDDPIDIAISGGGVRSACFAAGALFALAEHGLLHRVRTISSTSGGSLVNAVAARAMAVRHPSQEEDVMDCLAAVPVAASNVELSPYRSHLRGAIPSSMIAVVGACVWSLLTTTDLSRMLLVVGLVTATGLAAMLGRDVPGPSLSKIERFVAFCCDEIREPYWAEDCSTSPALHVFVACEMSSGKEAYFCTGKGRGDVALGNGHPTPWDGPLAPLVLDTMRFPEYAALGRLRWGPERLPLADGGLLDNEATSFFLRQPGTEADRLSTIISIAAPKPVKNLDVATAAGDFGLVDRLRIAMRAGSVVHRRLTEYPLRILEEHDRRKVIRIRPTSDLGVPTSLRRLKIGTAMAVFRNGRDATTATLGAFPHLLGAGE